MAAALVVTEVDSSKLPKSKAKGEYTKYVEELEFLDQEEYQITKDRYQQSDRITLKDLVAVCKLF